MERTIACRVRRGRAGAILAAALLGGCATARFDARRPVDTSPVLHVHFYRQGGAPIQPSEIADQMSANPALAPALEGYSATAWAGTIFLGGGLLVGSAVMLAGTLQESRDVNAGKLDSNAGTRGVTTGIGIALGGFVVGSIFHAVADRQLLRAVEQHNGSLRPGGAPGLPPAGATPEHPPAPAGAAREPPTLAPFLAAAPGPDRRLHWRAGLQLRF